MKNSRLALLFAIVAAALAANAYADQPSESLTKEALQRVEARITAIDRTTRTLSLCCANGLTTIEAGPEIRNFDKMQVGDKVHASYYAALTVGMKKKGGSAQLEPTAIASLHRAPIGSRPAGVVGRAINATVKIESIDTKANTVTFKRSNEWVTLDVESPEGQQFIRTLHPGDEVEVNYIEALAIEVVPVE